MFGIDFSELVVCALVALVVIGPERMPEAVRTAGLWIGRLKRSLHETREQVEQQLGLEEVRRQLHTEQMMRTLDSMQEEIETALNYERMGSKAQQAPVALAAADTQTALEIPQETIAQIDATGDITTDLTTDLKTDINHRENIQPAAKNT